MTSNDFCLWLQGYVELGGGTPTDVQWAAIKDHLQLVMDKKTPVRTTEVVSVSHPSGLPAPFWTAPEPSTLKITC